MPDSTANKPEMPKPPLLRDGPLSFLLSLVAGFVDTAGFVALFGLFTAHVTGNLLLVGASLVKSEGYGIAVRLLVIPIFMLAVMFASWLAQTARKQDASLLGWLLWAEALALLAFFQIGASSSGQSHGPADDGWILATGASAVVAMGIHNALMREATPGLLPTTVMTGNLTMFSTDLLTLIRGLARGPAEILPDVNQARLRMRRTIPVLSGFVFGAALGAFGYAYAHWKSIGLPSAIVIALALSATRHHHHVSKPSTTP